MDMFSAASKGDLDRVRLLVEHGDDKDKGLQMASFSGHLAGRGANLGEEGKKGKVVFFQLVLRTKGCVGEDRLITSTGLSLHHNQY